MDSLTLNRIADFICGDDDSLYPNYRTSSYLTRFFADIGRSDLRHDGSTRWYWVRDALDTLTDSELERAIKQLVDIRTYSGDRELTEKAIETMNDILVAEGLKVKYDKSHPELVECSIDLFPEPETMNDPEHSMVLPDCFLASFGQAEAEVLRCRCEEAAICTENAAYTMSVIAMGSALEGMLLFRLESDPAKANHARKAPRNKDQKVRPFQQWKLTDMIAVAHELGWIDKDVHDFSIVLRDFRNYIHPNVAKQHGDKFDADTCAICWQVLLATANDLERQLQ